MEERRDIQNNRKASVKEIWKMLDKRFLPGLSKIQNELFLAENINDHYKLQCRPCTPDDFFVEPYNRNNQKILTSNT